nr:hypothetical transcript [Hymenolepis microstoma]
MEWSAITLSNNNIKGVFAYLHYGSFELFILSAGFLTHQCTKYRKSTDGSSQLRPPLFSTDEFLYLLLSVIPIFPLYLLLEFLTERKPFLPAISSMAAYLA